MEKFQFNIEGTALTRSELNETDALLLAEAEKAADNAYAPYSEFHVGAALKLEDGTIVLGSNQENVAYPSGLCAERVAIFSASSNHPKERVLAMAITVKTEKTEVVEPLTPCGNCRQVIMEYQHNQQSPIKLILAGESEKVIIFDDAAALLPFAFEADYLKNS